MATSNQPGDSGEHYRDPLENYDPKSYDDPLERALATEPVSAIQAQPFVTIPPQTTVEEAMTRLVDLSIACLLVEEDERCWGCFPNGMLSTKLASNTSRLKACPIREFMTSSPIYVFNTDSSAAALSVMAATGYRHVPVVDLNQRIVGVVRPQPVASFLERYFQNVAPNT